MPSLWLLAERPQAMAANAFLNNIFLIDIMIWDTTDIV
jgi:hypothetical protein